MGDLAPFKIHLFFRACASFRSPRHFAFKTDKHKLHDFVLLLDSDNETPVFSIEFKLAEREILYL